MPPSGAPRGCISSPGTPGPSSSGASGKLEYESGVETGVPAECNDCELPEPSCINDNESAPGVLKGGWTPYSGPGGGTDENAPY